MMSIGLSAFSVSLCMRALRAIAILSETGLARKSRWNSGSRTIARNCWYATSRVHHASPCARSVGDPPMSTVIGSASSVVPVVRAKSGPSSRSRLPCITRTRWPERLAEASAATTGAAAAPASSPIQKSKRSPRITSSGCAGASSRMKRRKRASVRGRSGVRCRSEMKIGSSSRPISRVTASAGGSGSVAAFTG